MDERLEKALDFSNYRITIENQKRNLKARIETLQTIMYNNGVWKADQLTISFVNTLISNNFKNAIVQDSRNNPIQIDDLNDFLSVLLSSYTAAMTENFYETQKLAKARNIKKIMDW
jgi:hypothetical protein